MDIICGCCFICTQHAEFAQTPSFPRKNEVVRGQVGVHFLKVKVRFGILGSKETTVQVWENSPQWCSFCRDKLENQISMVPATKPTAKLWSPVYQLESEFCVEIQLIKYIKIDPLMCTTDRIFLAHFLFPRVGSKPFLCTALQHELSILCLYCYILQILKF